MQKFFLVLISALALFTFVACGDNADNQSSSSPSSSSNWGSGIELPEDPF